MLELQNFSLKRNKGNQTTTREHKAKINQLLIPNINMNLSNILREKNHATGQGSMCKIINTEPERI